MHKSFLIAKEIENEKRRIAGDKNMQVEIQKIGAQVRTLQMKFNKVVSEASRIIDFQSGSPGIRVEVKAMDTANFRV